MSLQIPEHFTDINLKVGNNIFFLQRFYSGPVIEYTM